MCCSFYLQCFSLKYLSSSLSSFRFLLKRSFLRESCSDHAFKNSFLPGSSLMAQWGKDLSLPLLWLGWLLCHRFDPWPWNFCIWQAWPKTVTTTKIASLCPWVHSTLLPSPVTLLFLAFFFFFFSFQGTLTQSPAYKTQHKKYIADVPWLTTGWGLRWAKPAPAHPLLGIQGTPPKVLHGKVFTCLQEKRKGRGNP